MLISVFLVYAVGFACSLDALDGSLCNLVLFAEFGNLTGQYCSTVSQFRWSIFSPHLLDDFRPLRGGFYLPGQALAVVRDCLQGWELVVVNKKACSAKGFSRYLSDALQFRAVDAGCCFLGRIPN